MIPFPYILKEINIPKMNLPFLTPKEELKSPNFSFPNSSSGL